MKVIVRAKQRQLNIPIPMWVMTNGIRVSILIGKSYAKKSLKQNKEFKVDNYNNKSDISKYIDIIDQKVLIKIMKKIKKYKGLKLVEIESKTGEQILITI